jgi:hypothetical protein
MHDDELPPPNACCESRSACIFSKALLARAAVCELAQRRAVAEREIIECPSPVARTNCDTLAALLHERARFALRLPGPGQPLIHAHALRLQCGGLKGLQQALAVPVADVHRMVGLAHERHGSLTDLPWASIVRALAQWQPHRSRRIARE